MKKLVVVLLGAAACVALIPCLCPAQTTYTFYPIEDAWVNEANPAANYGNTTYLTVRDRSDNAEAYLKFSDTDLARLDGRTIASASLFLYQYQDTYSAGDSILLHSITGDWQENAVNWNTRPAYESAAVSALNLTGGNLLWREWSGLEGCVASWQAGENYGLALENGLDGAADELFARFYSSEFADAGLRPYLRVTTTPEPVASTLFLLGGGLLSFIPRLRRKA
ncbi:MAG: DNRLRE domain-containing protein [Candidatus Omnitrophica bacterium]|nr:DNRLRE domain-containing protein [Candidatus Omnitrophota bacterium]